jgi:hypothetical protein
MSHTHATEHDPALHSTPLSAGSQSERQRPDIDLCSIRTSRDSACYDRIPASGHSKCCRCHSQAIHIFTEMDLNRVAVDTPVVGLAGSQECGRATSSG